MLTVEDLALLAMEKLRWNHQGAKATAVHDVFGLSLTAYYQRVRALTRRPEAMAAEPQLVNRLLRLEQTRAARRTAALGSRADA